MTLVLSPEEQVFVKKLAGLTGLNTRTLQGWVAQEEGTRHSTAGRGDANFLNVGITDTGPLGFTHDASWRMPGSAAANTAAFLKGQKFGASQGIRDILKTAGGSPMAQVKAIQGSGWASGGETSLAQLVGQTKGLHGIGGAALPPSLRPTSHAASVKTTTQDVAPDTSLLGAIQALQSQSQAPPREVPTSFNPGGQFGSSPPPFGAVAPATAASGNDASLASLSQLVGPSSFTKTTTTPGTTPAVKGPTGASSGPVASGPSKMVTITYGGVPAKVTASTTIPRVGPSQVTTLKGLTLFKGVPVASWIAPILRYAQTHGWGGSVGEGYRTDAQQTAIYRSGVRPAAVPKSMGGGGSNHSFQGFPGGAVDVSDAPQLSAILQRSPYASLLVWAGGKDPVHFSHPHNGSY